MATKRLQRVLFVPDCHVPYENKRAFELMLKVARRIKPDIIVVLGDFADMFALSAHGRDSDRAENLKWEVAEVRKRKRQLEALGAKRMIFVAGNHEHRLERYLADKAPQLFSFVKTQDVLQLRECWEYVPYKSHIRLGKVFITHDTGKAGANAHVDALNDFQDNAIIGHTHRIGYAVKGNANGVPHVAAMFGWLGDAEAADYMHKIKASRDWAMGFGLGYLEPAGNIHLQPVPIVPRKDGTLTALVEGKVIEG